MRIFIIRFSYFPSDNWGKPCRVNFGPRATRLRVDFCHASWLAQGTQGGEAAGAQGQLWSCAEVGGPMPTVSATAPATATRRPPSPILTHRLRWRIAAHLVGDEVFFSVDRGASTASGGNFMVGKCDPPLSPASSAFPSPPNSLPPLLACAGAHCNGLRDRRGHRPRDSSTGRPTLIFFGAS